VVMGGRQLFAFTHPFTRTMAEGHNVPYTIHTYVPHVELFCTTVVV
jgi:hypothetical protein